jgi:hypothetical protein
MGRGLGRAFLLSLKYTQKINSSALSPLVTEGTERDSAEMANRPEGRLWAAKEQRAVNPAAD